MIYPQALHVSGSCIDFYDAEPYEDIEADPRGLFLMWEPPERNAKYIVALDPTEGITGWTRAARTDGDHKTDNAAIEIFKVNGVTEIAYKEVNGVKVPDIDPNTKRPRILYRDVQVGEYAAPVDAVESARVANLLGRIYCGQDDESAELIWEAWPGPGILSTQELLRLGYPNLWHWQYIVGEPEDTNGLGWRSSLQSQRLLWYRARRHLLSRQALIRSKFLLEEYANAEIDLQKMRARAAYGYHDDRFQAANMAFWAGHKWAMEEVVDQPVTEAPIIDPQRYGPGLQDDFATYSDWRERAMAELESEDY